MHILADFHAHSNFSGDCHAPMEKMIQSAIEKGLNTICFTEHNDFDFPYLEGDKECPEGCFELNVDSYLYELLRLKKKYEDQIDVLFGIELGLQSSCVRKNAILSKAHDYDFIIASSHLCGGQDPYRPDYFNGKELSACYRQYFEEILSNVKSFLGYDVYGHLDYMARYAPDHGASYSYADYADLIDEILTVLIENEKAIECNTSGLRKPFGQTNPVKDILVRYRELGGEIITVGSDAHRPEDVAYGFDQVEELLKSCGFKYYSTFIARHPYYHKL